MRDTPSHLNSFPMLILKTVQITLHVELGGFSPTSRLADLYRYIRGIPLPGDLKLPAAALAIPASLALAYHGGVIGHAPLLTVLLLSVIPLNYLISRLGLGLMSFRRLNAVLMVDYAAASIGGLIASMLPTPFSDALFSAFFAASTSLRFMVYSALWGENPWGASLIASASSIIQALPTIIISQDRLFSTAASLGYIVGAFIALFTLTMVNRFRIRGVKPLSMLTSLLEVFFEGRKENLERLVSGISSPGEVKIETILFMNEEVGKKIALVIPDFHPGPFRNFGSSMLPYMITERLEGHGISAVVVRGLSGHSRNIVSEGDCEMIADAVAKEVAKSWGNTSWRHGWVYEVQHNYANAKILGLPETRIVFLTLHPKGMEDIPPIILDNESSNIIPVDTHNSFSDNVRELDVEDLDNLSRLLRKAEKVRAKSGELVAGMGRDYPHGYGLEDGIGPHGVTALILGPSHRPLTLIILDGNNALPSVRERIIEELRIRGAGMVEVLTTDTHLVNGVRLGGRGYHPLGEVIPAETLSRHALKAYEEALRNLGPVTAGRITLRFRGLKMLSEEFLEEAWNKSRRSARLALMALYMAPITALALTLAAALL